MNEELHRILDQCVDLLREGRSVEQCLLLYPELADELEPLLRVAGTLQRMPRAEARPEAMRAALLRAGAALPGQPGVLRFERESNVRRRLGTPVRAVWRWAAAAAVVFVLTVGLGTASARSAPGDWLYPLKLVTERVAFAVTTSPDRRAELRLSFADRRLDELVRTAQASGRIDPDLLGRLLNEATFALEDAKPESDERYGQLLTRIDAFNSYQRRMFEHLQSVVQSDDTQLLTRAISVCDERRLWIRRAWGGNDRPPAQVPGSSGKRSPLRSGDDKCWDSGCRWD